MNSRLIPALENMDHNILYAVPGIQAVLDILYAVHQILAWSSNSWICEQNLQ